jgi:hypothetical protein
MRAAVGEEDVSLLNILTAKLIETDMDDSFI